MTRKRSSVISGKSRGGTLSCRPGDTNPSNATECQHGQVHCDLYTTMPCGRYCQLHLSNVISCEFVQTGLQGRTRGSSKGKTPLKLILGKCVSDSHTTDGVWFATQSVTDVSK